MVDDRRVVVVGSGPAGAMAAHELVRKGIPVTLLEAGDDIQHGVLVRIGGRNFYRRLPPMRKAGGFVVTGNPETNLEYTYALGGLSNQWTGAVPRFCAEDFTAGEQVHEKFRWPVSYDELAPYYEIAERHMRVTAGANSVPSLPAGYSDYQHQIPSDWQQVARSALKHGQGMTTMPLADGPPFLLLRRGTAFNSYALLLQKLRDNPAFRLVTGAHVLMLEWDRVKQRAGAAVYYDRQTETQKRVSGSAFVIACGPLNSPKLLFNSACSDRPHGLGNSAGLLGKYLHDHPREWWAVDIDKPITSLSPPAYLTRLPHTASDPLLACSWTLGAFGTIGKIKSRFGQKSTSFGVQVFGTMIPKEKYYVRPSRDQKDEFGLPKLEVHIEFEEEILANVISARQYFLQLMENAGYKGTIRDIVPQLFPGTAKHYGGAARMHASPEFGVTDSFQRLHDAPNVLVVDASSFTTGAEKNPTLTVMALAARSAGQLARDLKANVTG
ncbi:GMC family oxidoreductase [Hyphomicrobium sp.]|uniref:GMC family oxidoreductase n=1 Tax=Hyphomicrobium sp. TaxID=82 RepID=UPI002D77432E|nr:GMC family oxidoreductase [Hyphomicrobium sp.]HET6389437.1 GMC family oxidoreductase [Hyphomicrobium sp.]